MTIGLWLTLHSPRTRTILTRGDMERKEIVIEYQDGTKKVLSVPSPTPEEVEEEERKIKSMMDMLKDMKYPDL